MEKPFTNACGFYDAPGMTVSVSRKEYAYLFGTTDRIFIIVTDLSLHLLVYFCLIIRTIDFCLEIRNNSYQYAAKLQFGWHVHAQVSCPSIIPVDVWLLTILTNSTMINARVFLKSIEIPRLEKMQIKRQFPNQYGFFWKLEFLSLRNFEIIMSNPWSPK